MNSCLVVFGGHYNDDALPRTDTGIVVRMPFMQQMLHLARFSSWLNACNLLLCRQ